MNLPLDAIDGHWRIDSIFIRRDNQWKLAFTTTRKKQVWQFEKKEIDKSDPGEITAAGILTRFVEGRQSASAKYLFIPGKKRLYVNQSQYADDGSCLYNIIDTFLVRISGTNRLWLRNISIDEHGREEEVCCRLLVRF